MILFNSGDIVYNNDTSFWTDLLINFIGSLLGFIGAYAIYYLQNEKEKKKELERQKKIEIEHFQYVDFLIRRIIKHSNNQAQKIKDFGERLMADSLNPNPLAIIANYDLERISNIDNEKTHITFKSLFSNSVKNFNEEYIKIFNGIDLLKAIDKRTYQLYEKFLDNFRIKQESFKTQVEQFSDEAAIMLRLYRKKNPYYAYDPIENELNNLLIVYNKLTQDNATTLTDYCEKFIKPWRDIIFFKIGGFDYDDIIFKSKQILILHNDLLSDNYEIGEIFVNQNKSMIKTTETLEGVINGFKI